MSEAEQSVDPYKTADLAAGQEIATRAAEGQVEIENADAIENASQHEEETKYPDAPPTQPLA